MDTIPKINEADQSIYHIDDILLMSVLAYTGAVATSIILFDVDVKKVYQRLLYLLKEMRKNGLIPRKNANNICMICEKDNVIIKNASVVSEATERINIFNFLFNPRGLAEIVFERAYNLVSANELIFLGSLGAKTGFKVQTFKIDGNIRVVINRTKLWSKILQLKKS